MDEATYTKLKDQWSAGGVKAFGTQPAEVEGVFTTIARINPFATGRKEMEANEKKGDDMMNGAMQNWRSAGNKLKAGDVDGYMKDYRAYVGKLKDANGFYSSAESGKAAMADQAMNQAQQTFNASTEALSAISNPAGYAIGKGVSYGTTKIIDYAAPNMNPTLKKVLVTGVSFVGSSYGSGLASGVNANIMKPLVETGLKTEVATTLAQTYVTYHTEGGRAALEDLVLAGATHAASNVKGPNGKTLGETIAGTGQAHGAAIKDNVVAAGNAANNAVKSLTGSSEGGQALKQADDAAYHNPKGNAGDGPVPPDKTPKSDPHDGKPVHGPNDPPPPPPLDPKAKDHVDTKPKPKFSEETNKALIESGNHPDAVSKLQHASDATGVAVAIPGTDPKGAAQQVKSQAEVLSGNATQKKMGMDTKSMATTSDIPLNAAKGKMGDSRRKLGDAYAKAKADAAAPGAGPEKQQAVKDARKKLETANSEIKAATKQNKDGIKDGKWKAKYDAESKTKVMHELQPDGKWKKIKPDIDPITTNANKGNPKPQVNTYAGLGNCSAAEARFHQAAAQSQGRNGVTNHASDYNSPHGPKPLADSMVFIEPGKPPVVVKGHENIVNHMDKLGMDVHPTWKAQADTAKNARMAPGAKASSTAAGQAARNSRDRSPSTDKPTSQQHQLRQTRIESQNQYMREAQTAAGRYPNTPAGKTAATKVTQQTQRDYSSNVKRYTAAQSQSTQFERAGTKANGATGQAQGPAMKTYGQSRQAMQKSLARDTSRQARANQTVSRTFSPASRRRGSLPDVTGLLNVALRLPLFMPPGMADQALAEDGPMPWRDEEEMRLSLASAAAFAEMMDDLAAQEVPEAVADDNEPILQSEVHVQVHELSSPAWRADFERRPAFHEGVVEYFTRQVMSDIEQEKTPANPSYPAFVNEVAIAYRLAGMVGEDALREAYFTGNTRLMFYRIGQRLGIAGVPQAEATGRRFLDQASLLMNRGRYSEVQSGLDRYQPPGKAGARSQARPMAPYRSGS